MCAKRDVFFLNVGDLLIVLRIDTGASLIQRHNAEPKYKDMPDAGFKDRCSDRSNAGLLFQVGFRNGREPRIIKLFAFWSEICKPLLYVLMSPMFFQVQGGSVVCANISINTTSQDERQKATYHS